MKLFTKLALVSSIAISANAMAMQQMDDAALSATTGQDGINIGIDVKEITIGRVAIIDTDGLDNAVLGGNKTAGSINLNDLTIKKIGDGNLLDLVIDTDGGTSGTPATNSPFLNIGAKVAGLDVEVKTISLSAATKDTNGFYTTPTDATGDAAPVLFNNLKLKTGAMTANIQLGNAPQGALITLDGSMKGGLAISNITLKDTSLNAGGSIGIDNLQIKGEGASGDLNFNAKIQVDKDGIKLNALDGQKLNLDVQGVRLGTIDTALGANAPRTNAIGDIQISNLQLIGGANIKISGH
ncbi:hypothetical protein EC844_13515 [Acinetobacter calcoaceticus]|uniref:DUF6160 domain-containing protein n=1 Tax=Acinetobacter calcoaceticus TaxID=471 RepID=A0A4R1XB59_ACICA|nr:hypothetical protein EC844_13515 [Acinetobacter calcoaceticus]